MTDRTPYFEIVTVLPTVLAIADRSAISADVQVLSVTNGAEAVVAALRDRKLLQGRRLIYRDTEGIWDEMLIDAASMEFAGFSLIGATSLRDALAAVAALSS